MRLSLRIILKLKLNLMFKKSDDTKEEGTHEVDTEESTQQGSVSSA